MNTLQSVKDMRKNISQSSNQAMRNPWVLGFLGVVVTFLVVNTIFIIMAFVSSPGLVVEDYYERGREYEKNALKMLAATQNTRQWETRLDIARDIVRGQENVVRFTAVDERGLPVRDAQAQLVAYRPSDADADIITSMEEIATGMFQASVTFPLKGIWDVNIKVTQGSDKFELARRISVKQ